ncbi:hypothetical protein CALVIDRAFT_594990 [Calocera viscosa TUFC12733]|uniref:HIT domain-containing protein n=1 Tax=Calocera viscosa (strain TUFC12733) TaxID=1330018 RepID=A0A167RE74_CALVF|nr:hypothetical protein CALVIDRAFT_594990 [Calocera viscosa TUFC12733]
MPPSHPHPYAPRLGCPLCTIVACSRPSSAPPSPPSSAQASSAGPSDVGRPSPLWITPAGGEVIYTDEEVTAYIERREPVSSKGHIVLVLNAHIPSLYDLTPGSIPLLQRLLVLAPLLLSQNFPSHPFPPTSPAPAPEEQYSIGFLTPPLYDPRLPVRDHLHLHAYLGRADKAGWWGLRALAYGPVGWYGVEDLIAEIRESTSNNRVKTGYAGPRPIAQVPEAGVRTGLPDGRELLDPSRREPPREESVGSGQPA